MIGHAACWKPHDPHCRRHAAGEAGIERTMADEGRGGSAPPRGAAIAERPGSDLPLFIIIGLHTGARKEAILSLRWPQVDLEAGPDRLEPLWPHVRRSQALAGKARIPRASLCSATFAAPASVARISATWCTMTGRRIKDPKKAFSAACRRAGVRGRDAARDAPTRAPRGACSAASGPGSCQASSACLRRR